MVCEVPICRKSTVLSKKMHYKSARLRWLYSKFTGLRVCYLNKLTDLRYRFKIEPLKTKKTLKNKMLSLASEAGFAEIVVISQTYWGREVYMC